MELRDTSVLGFFFGQVGFHPSNLFDAVPVLPDFIPKVLVSTLWLLSLLNLADRQGDVLAVGEDVQPAHYFHDRMGYPQNLAPLGGLRLALGRSESVT